MSEPWKPEDLEGWWVQPHVSNGRLFVWLTAITGPGATTVTSRAHKLTEFVGQVFEDSFTVNGRAFTKPALRRLNKKAAEVVAGLDLWKQTPCRI